MAVRLNGEEVKVDEKVIVNSNGNELDIIEQVVAQEEGKLPMDEEETLSLEEIENETNKIKQKEFELRVQKAMFETKVVTSDIICGATLTHINKWCSYLQNGETPPEKMHNGMLLLKDSLDVVYKDGVGTMIYNEVRNLTPEKIYVYLESIKDMLPKYIKSKNDALGGRDAVKVYLDIEDVEVREVNKPEDSKEELDKEVNTFAKTMQEIINDTLSDVDNIISTNTNQNHSNNNTSDTSILEWVGYAALAGAAAYGLYLAYDTFFGESSDDMGDVVIINSADAFNIHI